MKSLKTIITLGKCKRIFLNNKLSNEWKIDKLSETCSEITLNELNEKIDLMLQGKLKGRTVVKMDI